MEDKAKSYKQSQKEASQLHFSLGPKQILKGGDPSTEHKLLANCIASVHYNDVITLETYGLKIIQNPHILGILCLTTALEVVPGNDSGSRPLKCDF